jgi:hypothetical protein
MNDLVATVLERCLDLETATMPVEFDEHGEATIWLPETLEADPTLAARVTERRLCMLVEDDSQDELVRELNNYSAIEAMNASVTRFNLPDAKTWVLAPGLEDHDLHDDLIALYGLEVVETDGGWEASDGGMRPVRGATKGEALARAALEVLDQRRL